MNMSKSNQKLKSRIRFSLDEKDYAELKRLSEAHHSSLNNYIKSFILSEGVKTPERGVSNEKE